MVTLQINGSEHRLDVPEDMPLLWALRDPIGLMGTKFGCGIARCGACTVLMRITHNVLYGVPFTTRENAEGPIGTSFARVCPGTLGGHEWNGAAYSAHLSALFVPETDWCDQIRQAENAPDPEAAKKGALFMGGEMQFDPWSSAKGWLTAFDAATGEERWRYQSSNR